MADRKLEDLSSKMVMQKNGWKIEAANSMDTKYSKQCGNKTWFGYNYGSSIGSLSTRFHGNGTATLNFGNCYRRGLVIVYLNGIEISRAHRNTLKMETNFEYSKGDVLSIKEFDVAIIKLNSLKLSHQGEKTMYYIDGLI